MMISGISAPREVNLPERDSMRSPRGDREGSDRFSLDPAAEAEDPGEMILHNNDRSGAGRRRSVGRMNRRVTETHGGHDTGISETSPSERGDFDLQLDPDESRGEAAGTTAEDRAAAAADFEALTAHLLKLGGPIREVTLYLPSLGRVTARMEAGAISIVVAVPRRLAEAVRRSEPELVSRMEQLGLRVSRIQIDPQDEPEPDRARAQGDTPIHPAWPTRGLVDVMA